MPESKHRTYPGWAIVVAAFFIIAMIAREASIILAPLLLALAFATTAAPLVERIARLGVGRGVGIAVIMIGLVVFVAAVVWLVAGSFEQLSEKSGEIVKQLDRTILALKNKLSATGIGMPSQSPEKLIIGDAAGPMIETPSQSPDKMNIGDAAGPMIEAILGGLGTLASNMFLFVFAAVFMLIEATGAREAIEEIEEKRGRSFTAIHRLIVDVRQYMGLKTLTSLANAILMMIWLAVLGVPFVLIWGLLSFLANFIPNIGVAIPAFAASVVALAENGLVNGILTGVGFVIVSTLIQNIIEPRIFGRGLGLSMSWVFISLILWGWMLGPIGMLLAVPLTMMVKRLLETSDDTIWLARFLGKVGKTDSNTLIAKE